MSYSVESEIIDGCKKDDRSAQKALYDRFCKKMNAVSYRYTGSYDDAKDIVHDSFVKIFQKISSYSGEGSLEGWIRRIVVNHSINFINKKNKHLIKANEEEQKILNDTVALTEYSTNESELDSIYDADLTKEEIIQAINSLKDSYKIIFNLYVIDSLSHKEISELLNIKEELSRIRLQRARKVLQSILIGVVNSKRKEKTDAGFFR
ncbi:MAG TPA: RNA polymerase sigma factor [Cytophagaceae bacterium]|nr:RNA polymerase sigma factor [Cytophagaceae bacterium]